MINDTGPSADLLNSAAFRGELVALFETLVNVMFCAKDTDGIYVEVNTAFVQRTGRQSKREVIGRRATDLFAPERAWSARKPSERRAIATIAPGPDFYELKRKRARRLKVKTTKRLFPELQ